MENKRSEPDSWRTIFLHKDGKFYRAYQASAWLYSRAINEYKVTHRRFKSVDESVLFVGFPVESLMKWIPEEVQVDFTDEQLLRLVLPEERLAELCAEAESPKVAYEAWKGQHPITKEAQPPVEDGGRREHKMSESRRAHPSMFGLMQQILSFPIESKSPIECMLFLADVRKSIADHF